MGRQNRRLVAVLVVFLMLLGGLWIWIGVADLSPQLGLDLQGGVSVTLVPAEGQQVDEEILDQTVAVIRQRVDALGVAEPDIARQGETVLVQLPGIADREQAVEVIGRTAQLQFRPVLEQLGPGAPGYGEAPACDTLREGGPPAPDEEVVLCESEDGAQGEEPPEPIPPDQRTKYRMGPVAVQGDEVADATAAIDQFGTQYQVNLELTDAGADDFATITGQLACQPLGSPQRQLGIVLDDVVVSAPPMAEDVACNVGIEQGRATITTGGGEESARQLAIVLRTGALPLQLDFATSQSVSATLGAGALRAGLLAGAVGLSCSSRCTSSRCTGRSGRSR